VRASDDVVATIVVSPLNSDLGTMVNRFVIGEFEFTITLSPPLTLIDVLAGPLFLLQVMS
jgi:hypothetical protein